MPSGYPTTRPEGLIARIGIAGAHLEEAERELDVCAETARQHAQAAYTQLRGAREAVRHALEAARLATETLETGTDPLEAGLRKK